MTRLLALFLFLPTLALANPNCASITDYNLRTYCDNTTRYDTTKPSIRNGVPIPPTPYVVDLYRNNYINIGPTCYQITDPNLRALCEAQSQSR
jgi:hypothetical protein